MLTFTRVFLALSALAFLLIGLNTFHDPVAAMAGIDLVPASASALNEVRANYGSLQIAFGALLLAGALSASFLRPALWIYFAICGGLVAGRIVGLVVDGVPNHVILTLMATEVVTALVSALLLWRLPRAA